MKCSRCPAPAHFNFGGNSLLCEHCTLAMLQRCKISLTCVDKSSPHVVPAASLVPTGSSAVAGDNSLSALAPEMAADSATAPDLSDRPVAVAGGISDRSIPPQPKLDLSIPDFIKRDSNNIAPFARARA